MKLSLSYDWSCTPEEFWALYFDPDFAVRMYLESLGSTSAEIVSQEGDLTSGLVRTLALRAEAEHARTGAQDLRRGGRHDRGEHVRPRHLHQHLRDDPGHHGRQDGHPRAPLPSPSWTGKTVEAFNLEAKVKIFGVGPIVERFIESQARATQEKSVAFMQAQLGG